MAGKISKCLKALLSQPFCALLRALGRRKTLKMTKVRLKAWKFLPRARSTMPVALLLMLRCYNERRNEDSVKVPIQLRDFLIMKPHRHRRIRSDGTLKM